MLQAARSTEEIVVGANKCPLFSESFHCFEEEFQPYDSKKHHADASLIATGFEKYYKGKDQISLGLPLNYSLLKAGDVKKKDTYHQLFGFSALPSKGFQVCKSPPKRTELPLYPPDSLLAQASERHLSTAALNPFLSRQLSAHQSPGKFVCLDDGTLHTRPIQRKTKTADARKRSSSLQPYWNDHAANHNLSSPLTSGIRPVSRNTSQEQQQPAAQRPYRSASQQNAYTPNRINSAHHAQSISLKLFPVIDERVNPYGTICARNSVPGITPMITTEDSPELVECRQYSPHLPFIDSKTPAGNVSPRQHVSSARVINTFPGKVVGRPRASSCNSTSIPEKLKSPPLLHQTALHRTTAATSTKNVFSNVCSTS